MNLESYVERIRTYRFDFSDEIPTQVIHSKDKVDEEVPMYKVRKGWFEGVGVLLDIGISLGYLLYKFKIKEIAMKERWKKTGFHERLTTREDIDYANQVLDEILKLLS